MEGLTPLPPGAALARALARDRGRYNARVALARRRAPLEPARLSRALAEAVAPAVEAAAAAAPARVDAVAEALFDLALELTAEDVLDPARHPAVAAAWALLPRLARHLAEAPRRLAAALTNGALRLEATPGASAAAWLEALAEVAPACPDLAALLACGQVLAWRAGAAHWRASALRIWEGLSAPLARATLGLPAEGAEPVEALRAALADPFRRPGTPAGAPALRLVGRVGGFRGFGGPFLAPPRLLADGERLWAVDGEEAYAIHADCFGRTLVRVPGAPGRAAPAPGGAALGGDGTVALLGLRARFPALAGARAFAAAGPLLAVLPPHTHLVALVAWTAGEGA